MRPAYTYCLLYTSKRLRKVAKICEALGCRVQNSVFELLVDPAQLAQLRAKLEQTIDMEKDSVRLYRLGSNWRPRIESKMCIRDRSMTCSI